VVPITIFALLAGWLWQFRGRALIEHPGQLHPLALLGLLEIAVFPLTLLCGLASVISLILRFRRPRGVERQQHKCFTYAATLTLAVVIIGDYTYYDFGIVAGLLMSAFLASIPIAVGIAILRHRLYDIDVIINRTLVYGTLTATLALIYFGGVATIEAIFRTLSGQEQQPQLAIVVSTLVIAALFTPLRRRIQGFIDRRFYRRKYDAAKTLEAFSAKLRDETDLEALNDDLIRAVRETMQPAHVSLWLRSDAVSKKGEQTN